MKKLLSLLMCVLLICTLGGAALAEAPASEYAGETVTILTRYATYDAWDEVVELVEEKTGIKINTIMATTEYSDYCTKVSSALTIGDDSYDIMDVDELLGVTFEAAGYLEPIDEVVAATRENFLDSWLESISKGADGHYYLLPSCYSGIYLYVNKGLFEEAGLEYPTNMEEFIAAAQAITNVEKDIYGLGSSWMQGGYMFNDIQRLIKAFNGDFYDWDNEGTRNAIQFMHDQLDANAITPRSAISEEYNATNQKFADGKYGMIFMWQSGYSTCIDSWDNYEIIMIPEFEKAVTIMNSWGFGININSKHKEASKVVLEVLADYDVQIPFLDMECSQHKGVLASEEAALNPTVAALGEYGAAGVIEPREMPIYVNEIQDIMETNVSAFVSGQITLDECCANVNYGFEDLE